MFTFSKKCTNFFGSTKHSNMIRINIQYHLDLAGMKFVKMLLYFSNKKLVRFQALRDILLYIFYIFSLHSVLNWIIAYHTSKGFKRRLFHVCFLLYLITYADIIYDTVTTVYKNTRRDKSWKSIEFLEPNNFGFVIGFIFNLHTPWFIVWFFTIVPRAFAEMLAIGRDAYRSSIKHRITILDFLLFEKDKNKHVKIMNFAAEINLTSYNPWINFEDGIKVILHSKYSDILTAILMNLLAIFLVLLLLIYRHLYSINMFASFESILTRKVYERSIVIVVFTFLGMSLPMLTFGFFAQI